MHVDQVSRVVMQAYEAFLGCQKTCVGLQCKQMKISKAKKAMQKCKARKINFLGFQCRQVEVSRVSMLADENL